MSSQNLESDNDESALFISCIVPKRKASGIIASKKSKQARITDFKSSMQKLNDLSATNNDTIKNEMLEIEPKDVNGKNFKKNDTPESTSCYFVGNQKLINICPLCLNKFESKIDQLDHFQNCKGKTKFTTKELLNILETQKKQLREVQECSLPKGKEKKKKPLKSKKELHLQYDLALGLALSNSLTGHESEHNNKSEKKSIKNCGIKKKRNKYDTKCILKERTTEERQQIVREKAAVVLLNDERKELGCYYENKNFKISVELDKLQNKCCRLWNLSENEKRSEWFVEKMKTFLTLDEKKGNEDTNKEPQGNVNGLKQENIMDEILKLNLPKNSFDQDWRKFINTERFSDLIATSKDGKTVYLHTLVLNVRTPDAIKKDYELIFSKYNLSTILVFEEYLYCGTLNGLKSNEVLNLTNLANDLNYEELTRVLMSLQAKIAKSAISNDNQSLLTNDRICTDITVIDSCDLRKSNTCVPPEDKDMFEEEMVDLTQSSNGSTSSTFGEGNLNFGKSHWAFFQNEEESEKKLRNKEENENSVVSLEIEEVETGLKQKNNIMKDILSEFDRNDSFLQTKSSDDNFHLQTRILGDSNTKDLDDQLNAKNKIDDCIIISSDSDAGGSKNEVENDVMDDEKLGFECDVPYYDPYENYNHFSDCDFSPLNALSQPLIAKDPSPFGKTNDLNETLKADDDSRNFNNPALSSTPLTTYGSYKIEMSAYKSGLKMKRKKCDLTTSRIIRKSLRLSIKSPKVTLNRKKSTKNYKGKNSKKEKAWLGELTNSILNEICKSPMVLASTPLQHNDFEEVSPWSDRDFEIEEAVTPYPNYSRMEENSLKEHLAKYGLKKSLGKKKAQKILKRIYEELHPYLNIKTGKLLKKRVVETPKNHKKGKSRVIIQGKKGKVIAKPKIESKKNLLETVNRKANSKDSGDTSYGSFSSLDESTEYDSDGSEFENKSEILTQSVPGSPRDLPTAMKKFFELNPLIHQKILMYEPIWVKDLQLKLKETFNKHFKMNDLINYLDQKCITFRLNTKEQNQKRNGKKNHTKKVKKL